MFKELKENMDEELKENRQIMYEQNVTINKEKISQAWWRMLVIPVLWEAETGGSGFAASLSSLALSLSLSLST